MSNPNGADFPSFAYGRVDKGGNKKTGSGFVSYRQDAGTYIITFDPPFTEAPAVVGNQTDFGTTGESTLDQVTFPIVTANSCTVLTGGSGGNHEDRSFSFMAIGPQGRQAS